MKWRTFLDSLQFDRAAHNLMLCIILLERSLGTARTHLDFKGSCYPSVLRSSSDLGNRAVHIVVYWHAGAAACTAEQA
jgi:hypothetical protein